MKINITNDDGAVFLLDVSEQFSMGELKEILEAEFGTPCGEMALVYNMAIMADDQTLSTYNVHDGDVVIMTKSSEPPPEQPRGGGETILNGHHYCCHHQIWRPEVVPPPHKHHLQ